MNENCARSCTACESNKKQRKTKASVTMQETSGRVVGTDWDAMLEETASFGEKQVADGGERQQTLARIKETIDYMNSDQFTELSPTIQQECLNRHELCAFWAILGK